MRIGAFSVEARLREGDGGAGAGAIVLPSGERFVLGDPVVTIGRLPESVLVLEDPNVSRQHAEIRPAGAGFVLVLGRASSRERVRRTVAILVGRDPLTNKIKTTSERRRADRN